jgi:putative ABC transport system permease protein
VSETVLISVVSFIASLGILYLLSQWPEMRQLVKGSIALSDHPILVTVLALTSIVVGIVAGTYPALYVTSFQPALVLKGSFGLTPKGRQLRTGLLCLQFVITSIMAVYLGILELQSDYIYNSKCGYDREVLMNCWNNDLYEKRDALRNELLQLTGIEDVSYSQFPIGVNDQYMFWSRGDKDHVISFNVFIVDNHYLNTLGIKLTEGRNFNENEDNTYIINEAARQQWDWVELDKPLLEGQPKVIGVCENPRFATTRIDNNSSPLVLVVSDPNYPWFVELRNVNIRVAAGIDKIRLRKQIQEVFMRMGARHEPDVKFQDQQLEEAYQEEFLFIRQVIIFSIICLIITLIGVFCLTMFETEYRRKEIGIRKVMGSSTTEILTLLCRRYVWLLLGSFAVAAPVAWHLGNVWLQSFAEHTPIYWWLFPLALFVVSLVTLATIIIQSWRVANANPVESVKSE